MESFQIGQQTEIILRDRNDKQKSIDVRLVCYNDAQKIFVMQGIDSDSSSQISESESGDTLQGDLNLKDGDYNNNNNNDSEEESEGNNSINVSHDKETNSVNRESQLSLLTNSDSETSSRQTSYINNPASFTCSSCSKSYSSDSALKRHKREKHLSGEGYRCDICNKAFARAYLFTQHSKVCYRRVSR